MYIRKTKSGLQFYKEGKPVSPRKLQEGGMTGMMKARMAYADAFGNPAGRRMVRPPVKTYDFGDGTTGTHYMGSMDNLAIPYLQEGPDGQLHMIPDKGAEFSPETIRFDSPEDAEYFAEHYKDIAPMMRYKKGGFSNTYTVGNEYIVSEEEYNRLINDGYKIKVL